MPLNYAELNSVTRALMVGEFQNDLAQNKLYRGKYLTDQGYSDWPALLLEAIKTGNDESLAAHLISGNRLKILRERRKQGGGIHWSRFRSLRRKCSLRASSIASILERFVFMRLTT